MKMIFVVTVMVLAAVVRVVGAPAGDPAAVVALIGRVIPGHEKAFRLEYIPAVRGRDVYEIESGGGVIVLRGNSNVALATAFYAYLRGWCHASVSWTGDQLYLPSPLPRVSSRVRRLSRYPYRYLFNYCTFSYSMAFWDWPRWQRELDWMAMHGVNLALAITGQEAVWQRTLRRFGYGDSEIKEFIAGPAFTAWWLMGNLEGWGGPVAQDLIDRQSRLQQKIVGRMRELGIEPVLQGFYGMVPHSFARKFPRAHIHDPGSWGRYRRPGMLLPDDSLFAPLAAAYYEEQARLYGAARYFQGDPFHEGGETGGVDLAAAGRGIFNAMDRAVAGSVWVLQCWQENPRQAMIDALPKERVLVTNIMAEAKPQWGGAVKYWPARPGGFGGHDWIWSEIPNFGGRTGMTGKLDSTALDITAALRDARFGKTMKGIGAAPEAIGQDPVVYDLLFDMAWTDTLPDVGAWLRSYIHSRYGTVDTHMVAAWDVLRRTVYTSRYGRKDPPIESIVCARPGWNKHSASTWGEGDPDYDTTLLVSALGEALRAIPRLGGLSTYRYDLVNLTRQVLANRARSLYAVMQRAYESADIAAFAGSSSLFLQVVSDEDRLLGSQRGFLLGPWLDGARGKGRTLEDKDRCEWNARMLITTWTDTLNVVNDYSCREWSGLLRDYYLPRWRLFVRASLRQLRDREAGRPVQPIDDSLYFAIEQRWTRGHNAYPLEPAGDPVSLSLHLFRKYYPIIH
ncbi:MAG: alpha-N-acetylglucosaminidase [Bacteroidetes bacterium]|nr:alpha-N-acetylglucosaminidase [Bacteroidota bacterium]